MRNLVSLCIIAITLIVALPTHSAEATNFIGHSACAGVTLETPMTAECQALIASRPTPNVSIVPVDFGVVSSTRFLRFTEEEVKLYDAPNGNLVDIVETGYTYVTPIEVRDGWAKLSGGSWVSLQDASFTSPSTLSGALINGNMDMPFAWILWEHDATSTPAGRPDRQNGHLERHQVVNIYASINVNGWNWHLVGPNLWTNQKNISIVYPAAPTSFDGRWAGVNLFEQNLVAYENNRPIMASLISSGLKNGRWDTPTGTFHIGVRLEADRMSGAEGQADFYSLDQVPYAQYFNGLISLHGTYWHNSFGYPHSHGCVNLSVSDAKWLFEWLGEGSIVYVYEG